VSREDFDWESLKTANTGRWTSKLVSSLKCFFQQTPCPTLAPQTRFSSKETVTSPIPNRTGISLLPPARKHGPNLPSSKALMSSYTWWGPFLIYSMDLDTNHLMRRWPEFSGRRFD
jgi:hypothetical protein